MRLIRRLIMPLVVMSLAASALPAHADDPAPAIQALIDPAHSGRLIYPPEEALLRRSGSAELTCNISADGFAEDCTVLNATAPDFGVSARQMAMTSEFLPAYLNTKRVASVWHRTVRFSLPKGMQPSSPILDRSHTASPSYPSAATAHGIIGRIVVKCRVDAQGIAHDCEAGNGPDILRESSVAYFTLARFLPAVVDGKPVDANYTGNLNWVLDKNDGFN